MKIGIFCGLAASSIRKAMIYEKSISNAGHTTVIFSRGNIDGVFSKQITRNKVYDLFSVASHEACDFYISCNDYFGNVVSILNQRLGYSTISLDSNKKTNLHNLSPALDSIKSWESISDVPKNVPIFVKPIHGSGSHGGEEWSYKRYDDIEAFKAFIENEVKYGWDTFNYAQNNLGVLGKSIFQEYIENDGFIYHHYMNDGVSKHWMETYSYAPKPNTPCYNKITNTDPYSFKNNATFGTFCSFQAFPSDAGKPKIFDFNVRCSGFWSSIYHHICPDFFDVYFNNLLNKRQEKYGFLCDEFNMLPGGSRGKKVLVEDYPASGINMECRLEIK